MKKLINFIKKYYIWIILSILVIILFFIIKNILTNNTLKINNYFSNLFNNNIRNPWLTNIMKIITFFGSAPSLIIISLVSLFIIKNKKKCICFSSNLIIIFLTNILLKVIIQRERPIGYSLIDETGFSFPSGHSMISMAFYGYLIYLLYKSISNKKVRNISCILIGLLILLIGISRIYLGVHYVDDVLGGFIISIIYLIPFIKITNKYIKKEKD